MEAYTDFAEVYDTFMDETPYEKWADFLARLIEEYGISLILILLGGSVMIALNELLCVM